MTAAKQLEAETAAAVAEATGLRPMINEHELLAVVRISRTTLFRMQKAGNFPTPTYVSPNRRLWFVDEVAAWQAAVDEFNPSRGRGKGPSPPRRPVHVDERRGLI